MPYTTLRGAALRSIVSATLLVAAVCAAPIRSQDAKPAAEDTLPRLIAALDAEPLALIACRSARELPEKFAATTLSKMINDPQYERGEQYIENAITGLLGASPRNVWPEFAKSVSGPLVLVVLPGKPATPDDKNPPLRVVFLVQVNEADVAPLVTQQWPAVSQMVNSFMKSAWPTGTLTGADAPAALLTPAELKIVPTADLPLVSKFPEWVARSAWPKGEVVVRARPIQICAAARPQAKLAKPAPEKLPGTEKHSGEPSTIVDLIDGSGIDALVWSLAFNGELLGEQLVLDLAAEDSTFKKFAGAIRETVAPWEGLMSATAGDVDAAVLIQSDLAALGNDQPYVFQAIERYLRGKRWSKVVGAKPEALDPARFKFLTDRLQGSFGIVARPAITGELRLTLTSSIKAHKTDKTEANKENDTEIFRDEMIKGLGKLGAVFETLIGARKIGGALPLGAAFHGRGQFAAPVIGMSAGWAWLCSSSVSYQELTDAFKSGKTLAAREKKRAANAAAAANGPPVPPNGEPAEKIVVQTIPPANDWSAEDALRAEVNLDRVLKIGYAAWLLSANEGPALAGQKIPNDLLPPPQVFSRVIGKLRASAIRTGNRLELRSSCAFPGVTLGALGLLQDASESITTGRKLAAEAAEFKKNNPDADTVPLDKNKADKPAKDDSAAPPKAAPPAKETAPSKEEK